MHAVLSSPWVTSPVVKHLRPRHRRPGAPHAIYRMPTRAAPGAGSPAVLRSFVAVDAPGSHRRRVVRGARTDSGMQEPAHPGEKLEPDLVQVRIEHITTAVHHDAPPLVPSRRRATPKYTCASWSWRANAAIPAWSDGSKKPCPTTPPATDRSSGARISPSSTAECGRATPRQSATTAHSTPPPTHSCASGRAAARPRSWRAAAARPTGPPE